MTDQPKNAALVTGGAQRIGSAICQQLAEGGYDLAIHFHASEAPARALAQSLTEKHGIRVTLVQADLTDPDQADRIIAEASSALGPLGVLINNASLFEADELGTITSRSWHDHLAVNLETPVRLTQAFAAHAARGSAVINMIDQRVFALTPKFFSYTIGKAGLLTATRTMAQALAPKGIRVNGIGPGPTLQNRRQSDEDWKKQNDSMPLGHGSTPGDICGAVLYLIGAKAVTGQMIAVDGGQHLSWETPDVLVKE